MSKDQQESADKPATTERESATERFRTHLRTRLGEMRENARRIGASSSYIELLDRSSTMVLKVVAATKSAKEAESGVANSEPPTVVINISEFQTSGSQARVARPASPRPGRG